LDDVKLTNRTTRTFVAQIVVGESAVFGRIQTSPQEYYGAFYKKNAFAREHTISTTALLVASSHVPRPPSPLSVLLVPDQPLCRLALLVGAAAATAGPRVITLHARTCCCTLGGTCGGFLRQRSCQRWCARPRCRRLSQASAFRAFHRIRRLRRFPTIGATASNRMTLVKVTDTWLRAVVVVPRQEKCLAPYSCLCSKHGGTAPPNKPEKILCSPIRGPLLDTGVQESNRGEDGHCR